MTPLETLNALLCDPSGKCCIRGSDEDRRLIDEALAALAAAPAQSTQEPLGADFQRVLNKNLWDLYETAPAQPAPQPSPTPQADSVLEDAARYQWIRGPVEESTRYSRWRIEYWDGPNGWQPMQRERMDSAIDAARAQQKAGE